MLIRACGMDLVPADIESAARRGKLEEIQAWLQMDGSDINGFDEDGWTLLSNAACEGQIDMVRFLLANGADANAAAPGNYNPLHAIARTSPFSACLLKAATLVLDAGANVDARCSEPVMINEEGAFERAMLEDDDAGTATPLMYAAVEGHVPLIRLLLSRGASLMTTGNLWTDVVAIARSSGRPHATDLLETVCRAGGWRAYVREPRTQLLSLRILCERDRAVTHVGLHERIWGPCQFCPPGIDFRIYKLLSEDVRAPLIAASREVFSSSPKEPRTTARRQLPREVFWKILSFWRSARDFDPSDFIPDI